MSGVCAGRRGKVHPGDVIVGSLLYSYDTGASRTEYDKQGLPHTRFQAEPNPVPLDEQWLHRAQAFTVKAAVSFIGDQWLAERPPTLEAQGNWVLAQLHTKIDPASHGESARHCPAWKPTVERLRKLKYLSAQPPLAITDAGAEYIDDLLLLNRGRLPEAPSWRIHVAPIATGNNVMRDPQLFDRLSDSMRDILGVDMEAAAIASIARARRLHWVVMKGVMDYADDDKDDGLKAFASRASAECLIKYLREEALP
jgi:nucleoside phosphorylase